MIWLNEWFVDMTLRFVVFYYILGLAVRRLINEH